MYIYDTIICFLVCALSLFAIIYLITILRKRYLNFRVKNLSKYIWLSIIIVYILYFACLGCYGIQMNNVSNKYSSEMFKNFDICYYSNFDGEKFVKQEAYSPLAVLANPPYTYPLVEDIFWTTRFSFTKNSTYKSRDNNDDQSIRIKENVLVIKNAKITNHFLFKRTVHEENLNRSDSQKYYYKYNINALGDESCLLMVYHNNDYFILYEVETNNLDLIIEQDVILEKLEAVI